MKTAILFTLLILLSSCTKKVTTIGYEDVPKVTPVEVVEPKQVNQIELHEPAQEPIEHADVIYFDLNSDIVKEKYLSIIMRIVKIGNPVKLTGSACEIGTEKYNYDLGMRRAETTQEIFIANGIVVESVKSIGELYPVSAVLEENRYVKIECFR